MRRALRVLLLAAAGAALIVFCGCGQTQGQGRAARGVKVSEIHVTTRCGTVTLAGAVGAAAERELAVKVAEDAGGVLEVVNKIEVRG